MCMDLKIIALLHLLFLFDNMYAHAFVAFPCESD